LATILRQKVFVYYLSSFEDVTLLKISFVLNLPELSYYFLLVLTVIYKEKLDHFVD